MRLLSKFLLLPTWVKITLVSFVLVLFFSSSALAYILITPPKVISASPADNVQDIPVDQPIKIRFNKPISRKYLEVKIEPDAQGEWHYEEGLIAKHLFQILVFQPEISFKPDQTYTVSLDNIQGAVGNKTKRSYQFRFTTQSVPKVSQVFPADGSKNILPNSEIRVELDQPNSNLVEFQFIFDPELEFEIKLDSTKKIYILKPRSPLKQGIEYQFTINRIFILFNLKEDKVILRMDPEEIYRGTFATIPPPGVVSFYPRGSGVHIDSQIKVVFNKKLNKKEVEANFVISPTISGKFEWPDDKTLIYKPATNLAYETSYRVIIKAGPKDEQGGFIEQDIVYQFTTIGHVRVSRFSPANGSSGASVHSKIYIYFNQEVDHSSAERLFSLSPHCPGTFSWKSNTMIYSPSAEFARDTQYTVTIGAGVKSIYGLDSNQAFSSRFTTEPTMVKLSVPIYHQKYSLSCEVAALKMSLAFKGVGVSEDTLLSILGVSDPISRQGNIWGDPYEAFVGSVTGRQMTTGYGTYWGPIARVGSHYRSSQAFSGWGIQQVTGEILAGNPVIAWGTYGGGRRYEWQTYSGKTIVGFSGEHARVAVGFIGSPSNPSQIILNDSLAGQITWSLSKFLSNWGIFGNSGVVVR